MSVKQTLKSIRQYRKLFGFLTGFGFASTFLIDMLYGFVFGKSPIFFFQILGIFCQIPALIMMMRLSALRCPRCGDQIFRPRYVLFTQLEEIKCIHCDYLLSRKIKGKNGTDLLGDVKLDANTTVSAQELDTDPWIGKFISKESERPGQDNNS